MINYKPKAKVQNRTTQHFRNLLLIITKIMICNNNHKYLKKMKICTIKC